MELSTFVCIFRCNILGGLRMRRAFDRCKKITRFFNCNDSYLIPLKFWFDPDDPTSLKTTCTNYIHPRSLIRPFYVVFSPLFLYFL